MELKMLHKAQIPQTWVTGLFQWLQLQLAKTMSSRELSAATCRLYQPYPLRLQIIVIFPQTIADMQEKLDKETKADSVLVCIKRKSLWG